MAFGFIKKVFSFGKKEVVEERIDETAPLPPINCDALEALKDAKGQLSRSSPPKLRRRRWLNRKRRRHPPP